MKTRFATLRHFSPRFRAPQSAAGNDRPRGGRGSRQGSPARSRVRRPRAFHVQTNGYSLKVVQPLHCLPAGGRCSPYTTFPPRRTVKTASQPLPAVKLRGDRRPPRPIPYAAELLAFITPFCPQSLRTRGPRKNKPTPTFLQQHKQISASLDCLQDDGSNGKKNRGGGSLVK